MHAHGVLVGTTGADDANRLVAKRGVFPFGAVFAHEPRSALLLAWGTGGRRRPAGIKKLIPRVFQRGRMKKN